MAARRKPAGNRRPRRARNYLEHREQCQLVAWFRLTYPAYRNLLFAVPNGGRRSKQDAARFKAEGVVAGIPDLVLAVPREGVPGLFIEMKRSDGLGRTSREQGEVIADLRGQGYQVSVCHGAQEAIDVVTRYLAEHEQEG